MPAASSGVSVWVGEGEEVSVGTGVLDAVIVAVGREVSVAVGGEVGVLDGEGDSVGVKVGNRVGWMLIRVGVPVGGLTSVGGEVG